MHIQILSTVLVYGEEALVIVKIFCRVFYMYSLQTFMVFQILFSSLSKHAEIRQIKKPADFYIYVQLQIVILLLQLPRLSSTT